MNFYIEEIEATGEAPVGEAVILSQSDTLEEDQAANASSAVLLEDRRGIPLLAAASSGGDDRPGSDRGTICIVLRASISALSRALRGYVRRSWKARRRISLRHPRRHCYCTEGIQRGRYARHSYAASTKALAKGESWRELKNISNDSRICS